jgi:flagellin-specific chaperone FliS
MQRNERVHQVQNLKEFKFKALSLLNHAKKQLDQNNFDNAIELYKKAEKIFSEIYWPEGLNLVQKLILIINELKQVLDVKQELEKKIKNKNKEN